MKLIIESGATKADWLLLDAGVVLAETTTKGINPSYASEDDITSILDTASQELNLKTLPYSIMETTIYMAGAKSENNERIKTLILSSIGTHKVEVYSDLIGAARALYGDTEGLVGIIGTGSNAGFYDGISIRYQKPNLGYILGDEAGGVDLGKTLITSYFRNTAMPEQISNIVKRYIGDREKLIFQLYKPQRQTASAYLAGIIKYVLHHEPRSKAYLEDLFKPRFMLYLNYYILPIVEKSGNSELRLCGSIAEVFQDEISSCCESVNLYLSQVISRPIMRLVNYHQ